MKCRRSHAFFFNDTATTEIYTLSLHDALPIFAAELRRAGDLLVRSGTGDEEALATELDALTAALRARSEEHTSELQSRLHLVCRLLLEKKKQLSTAHRRTFPLALHAQTTRTVR